MDETLARGAWLDSCLATAELFDAGRDVERLVQNADELDLCSATRSLLYVLDEAINDAVAQSRP